jgi:hypothetical protein
MVTLQFVPFGIYSSQLWRQMTSFVGWQSALGLAFLGNTYALNKGRHGVVSPLDR